MSTPARRPAPAHVVVEAVEPTVDGGRFPAKAVAGVPCTVSADVFSHGHEPVRAHLRFRPAGARSWKTLPMVALGNDRFAARLVPEQPGTLEIEVLGEVDRLEAWRHDARRRLEAARYDPDDAPVGAALLAETASRLAAAGRAGAAEEAERLSATLAGAAEDGSGPGSLRGVLERLGSLDEALAELPPAGTDGSSPRYRLLVSRQAGAFSSWYECFPRSTSPEPGRAGTLADLAERLDYVERLGFDILYLPPIHPSGTTARKGRNNSPRAEPGDVGSPWAIGSPAGGHLSVDPGLGTLEDFDALVAAASRHGIEIALDLAFQCSPDHPWVAEHPDWFAHRLDGSVACAENPPKRYEDVYPLDFDTSDREGLWAALLEVVLFWHSHGVRIFRVDNPHTKPFGFWEWLLAKARQRDPGMVFLAEAFTRPKVMHRLAKLGFDLSYTYFTWRNTKQELTEYFEELAHGPASRYFRPCVWPNTPDILAFSLQRGGRAAFVGRLVLAACLSASYGIYGPPFELLLDRPGTPGTDGDYLDSEKYEIRHWDLQDPRSIAEVVAQVNRARHDHKALWSNESLRFHPVDNEQLICWSKHDAESGDAVVCVVNLDPQWPQSGFVDLDLGAIGLDDGARFVVHDLLDGSTYAWGGQHNFVLLDPARSPAHLLHVEGPAR